MASATPPHVVIVDCPPPIYDDDGAGRQQQRRVWTNNAAAAAACKKACAVVCPWVAVVLVGAAVVTGSVFLFGFSIHPLPPVYTVAITGVAGLDSARDVADPPTTSPPAGSDDDRRGRAPPTITALLSPAFNLTFQIDNTHDSGYSACVPGLSRAEVSYGGAFLAGSDVPPFCAADGEDRTGVAVPRTLWDQLAAELATGDASVDVKVTMPTHCVNCGGGAVLSCKPKIGGGPSPACRLSSL